MTPMTQKQSNAMASIVEWQNATLQGTPEHERAMIAGTMVITMLPLTGDQLSQINKIINY